MRRTRHKGTHPRRGRPFSGQPKSHLPDMHPDTRERRTAGRICSCCTRRTLRSKAAAAMRMRWPTTRSARRTERPASGSVGSARSLPHPLRGTPRRKSHSSRTLRIFGIKPQFVLYRHDPAGLGTLAHGKRRGIRPVQEEGAHRHAGGGLTALLDEFPPGHGLIDAGTDPMTDFFLHLELLFNNQVHPVPA